MYISKGEPCNQTQALTSKKRSLTIDRALAPLIENSRKALIDMRKMRSSMQKKAGLTFYYISQGRLGLTNIIYRAFSLVVIVTFFLSAGGCLLFSNERVKRAS